MFRVGRDLFTLQLLYFLCQWLVYAETIITEIAQKYSSSTLTYVQFRIALGPSWMVNDQMTTLALDKAEGSIKLVLTKLFNDKI